MDKVTTTTAVAVVEVVELNGSREDFCF